MMKLRVSEMENFSAPAAAAERCGQRTEISCKLKKISETLMIA
jgi:hypothetical protein